MEQVETAAQPKVETAAKPKVKRSGGTRSKLPVIAVVGRPNVGKSMIANRLTQQFDRGAIVFDTPGVTRDRTYANGWWNGFDFRVVDTGGIIYDDKAEDVFIPQIREQAELALLEAHCVLFVVDGQSGLTPLDEDIANFLRRQNKPIVVAVNKCESHLLGDTQAADFWAMGLGSAWPCSGIHGTGLGEVMDELTNLLPQENRGLERELDITPEIRVAFLGRPNSGKSSLLNRLTGVDRAIVSDVAGTTRDAVDQTVLNHGTRFTFVDTAGVRKKQKVDQGIEEAMVRRSLKAARRSDAVILTVDAEEGIAEQEGRLAQYVIDSGRACVIVVNKWDLVEEKNDKLYKDSKKYISQELAMISWAKAVYTSAKTGLKANTVFKAVKDAVAQHRKRVTTAVLNEVLEDGVRWQKPPTTATGAQGSIYYCAQVAVSPPTIVIFCNNPSLISDTYRRYLEKHFRKSLGFEGSPLRLMFKKRKARQL
jgi:GTP-binding protein